MKAKIIAAIIAVAITAASVTGAAHRLISWQFENRYYAQCCVVTEVAHKANGLDLVTVENCNGFLYEFWSDEEDWDIGDAASVIMDTNGTELVTDDEVVAAKYDRPDLLG